MRKHHRIGLSFLLVIILAVTSSSPAISQSEIRSWITRRLTRTVQDSFYPTIAGSGNYVHVVWVESVDGMYYRRSVNSGNTWRKIKPLLTKHVSDTDIATSGETVYVVCDRFFSNKNSEIFFKKSSNNGATWGKWKRLTYQTGRSSNPAIGASGKDVHVVWADGFAGKSEILYMRSANNGASWRSTKRLTRNSGSSVYPSIAVSGNNVHVVWQDETPGNSEIFYKRSENNGIIWGKQKRLTKNNGISSSPTVAVLGTHIYVTWWDTTSGNAEIYFRSSNDNGTTWGETRNISHNAGGSYYPVITTLDGDIHVVWGDYSPGNQEIHYRWSSDNGTTWSKTKRLTRNAGSSSFPDIVGVSNFIHVVWMDKTPGNWEIYYKRGP